MAGIKCTKSAIFVAEVEGTGAAFKVTKAWTPIECGIHQPADIQKVFAAINPVLEGCRERLVTSVAILVAASGMFGADNETIKVEGVVELVATQLGLSIVHVTPQSLKLALACGDEKWTDKAKKLLNPTGAIKHWTEGMNGAVAAAYKALTPPSPKPAGKAKK